MPMFNWLKKSTDNSRDQKLNGNLINSNVSFGDTITNIFNIPKKILLGVAVLLVILIAALIVWRGNFQTIRINNGTVNQVQINNKYDGISPEKLIELSKQLGVAENERDAWIQKYKDLEKQLASRSDDIAKQAQGFLVTGNLEEAEKLFKQALANDLKNAAANAFSLAEIKVLQLNQTEAKTYYQQAVQLDPDNAIYWHQLGNLLDQIGDLDEATAAYSKGVVLGETHQNQVEIANSYIGLGVIHRTRGDMDKCVEFQEKSLKLHEALGDKEGMAVNYTNLGSCYLTGDLDKAIEYQQKALTLNEVLGNKLGMAGNYINIGMTYIVRGKLDKAIEFQEKARKLIEDLGNKEGKESMALNYYLLGAVYYIRGELDNAIEYQQKSLKLNEALGSKENMARNYASLGAVYHIHGELDNAIEYQQKALKLNEALGSKEGIAYNYTALGDVYATRGDFDNAIEFKRKALKLNKALGDKLGMAQNYTALGAYHLIRHDWATGIKFQEKSLKLNEALGNKLGIAQNRLLLGLIYSVFGNFDQAIAFQEKSLKINEAVGRKEGVAQNYRALGLVYQMKGNKAEAKRYWQQSLELYKQLGSPIAKEVQTLLDKLN
jgi:protein O-GlcNAc transferase